MNTIYDILRRPLVTEKSNYQMNHLHQYVFEVARDATRSQVKDAVEKLFNVEVLQVNIMKVPAKRKRQAKNRQQTLRNPAYKKAIVSLSKADRIPFFEGVE